MQITGKNVEFRPGSEHITAVLASSCKIQQFQVWIFWTWVPEQLSSSSWSFSSFSPSQSQAHCLKSCPVDLRWEDEAAPIPLPTFPFPSAGEKTLCDPSFAHSYQLTRKMDLDRSKVCASKADLLSSSPRSLLMLFLKFSHRRKMPYWFSVVSMIRMAEIRMGFCSEVQIQRIPSSQWDCSEEESKTYAKPVQEWEWRNNAIEEKDDFGNTIS